jgi:L-amino acid N-acyltransferase YncA
MIDVRPFTFSELSTKDEFLGMLAEYAEESALPGLPVSTKVQDFSDTYLSLESAGVLHIYGAMDGDKLVGFLALVVTMLPKYTRPMASTESIFVSNAHRTSGAGMALLKAAERGAVKAGACGLLVSAPLNSRLAAVMEKTKYAESNRVFFKELK